MDKLKCVGCDKTATSQCKYCGIPYCGDKCFEKYSNFCQVGKKAKRTKLTTAAQHRKFKKVMKEFKKRKLRSSSGEIVTDKKQAIAIAFSEAKKA